MMHFNHGLYFKSELLFVKHKADQLPEVPSDVLDPVLPVI